MNYNNIESEENKRQVYVVLYQWYDTTKVVAIADTKEIAQHIVDKAVALDPKNAYIHVEVHEFYF